MGEGAEVLGNKYDVFNMLERGQLSECERLAALTHPFPFPARR